MKKRTNHILLGALAVALVLIIGTVFTARGILAQAVRDAETIELSGTRVEREYTVEAFSELAVSGGWRVDINQGSDRALRISGDSALVDGVSVEVTGGVLSISSEGAAPAFNGGLSAVITLPSLERIETTGSSDVRLRGFRQEEMRVRNHGASNVAAEGLVIGQLFLGSEGAGNFDFSASQVRSAEVMLEGAGNVELTMDGGALTGRISGLGNVEYGGTVAEESIRVDGLGSVERREWN
jgi:hypothetical protein